MEPLFEPEHVVIITGASSGIGQQAARLFAKKGVTKFCLTALDDLEETKKLCIEENGSIDIVMVAGDLINPETCRKIFNETINHFGRIDILINNAGSGKVGSVMDLSMDDYQQIFDVNLKAAVHLSKLCLPYLRKTGGNIVMTSSSGTLRNVPGFGFLCMAKSAMDMFTKVLAREEGPNGVRVNSVNPGPIDTSSPKKSGANLEAFAATQPLCRLGKPEEVAKTIVFLASKDASYTTGSCVVCDGGWAIV